MMKKKVYQVPVTKSVMVEEGCQLMVGSDSTQAVTSGVNVKYEEEDWDASGSSRAASSDAALWTE